MTSTLSLNTVPKPQHFLSIELVNHWRQTIQNNQLTKFGIQQLINDFLSAYLDFQNEVLDLHSYDLIEHDDHTSLKSTDLKCLDNHPTHERIQLVFCGSNSSGKTTFLHTFLKINNILPVGPGPINARIIKFTYASAKDSCLIIYPSIEKAFGENKQEEDRISLKEYFNNPLIDWKSIKKVVSLHVARPKFNTEDEFNDWAKKCVEIRVPSPILELNIDVYDTPGLLCHDYQILKTNLHELIRQVQPTLVFLYSNSSFSKDDNQCYLMIREALNNLEDPSIFYLNTKQDIATVFNGAGINTKQTDEFTVDKFHEILPRERLRRYQLLYSAIGIRNNLPIIQHNTSYECFNRQCDNFDISSILVHSLLPQCTLEMTEQACQRIIHFALKSEMKKFYNSLDSTLAMIENFFNLTVSSSSYRTSEQWNSIYLHAKQWSQHFFNKFENELSNLTDKMHENILHQFDICCPNIVKRAIRLDRLDDPLEKKTNDILKTNIKDFITIVVQEEVIKTVVNNVINETKNQLLLLVKQEMLIDKELNELLRTAQYQVLLNLSDADIIQLNSMETILHRLTLVSTNMRRFMSGLSKLPFKNYYYNQSSVTAEDRKEKYYQLTDFLDSFSVLTDESDRRNFAEEYLRRKRLEIQTQKTLYSENLRQWLANKKKMFDNNIQTNYNLAISSRINRVNTPQYINKYMKVFAEVECKLFELKDLAKFNRQLPIIDKTHVLEQETYFISYAAEWSTEKNLVAKKLIVSSKENSYLQYMEAHHQRKLTQYHLIDSLHSRTDKTTISMTHVVPLLYLYEDDSEDMKSLYMFMPRFSLSLEEYLKTNINKIKADRVLQIALDMIDVLILLHAHDIVHNHIKAKSILMDVDEQCYFMVFSTANELITNLTVDEMFELTSEINLNTSNDQKIIDIRFFGMFLFEILPKENYDRLENIKNIKKLFKNMNSLHPNNRIYENLIESCLESEPNATSIKLKLLECLKEIEKTPCILCEENPRKYRFLPCRHKLICESCSTKLPQAENGNSTCGLCRKPIDQLIDDENN